MSGMLLKSKGEELNENIINDEDELGDLLDDDDVAQLLLDYNNVGSDALDSSKLGFPNEEFKQRLRYLDEPLDGDYMLQSKGFLNSLLDFDIDNEGEFGSDYEDPF